MKKQLLLLVTMMLPMVASADDSGKCGDNANWKYVEATKTLTISGTGLMQNYGHDSSRAPWKKDIVKVIIENGITSIGNSAFDYCSLLTSVTIPNSVTSIGNYAFYGCGLTSINIPNSVTSIGNYAFFGCGLTSINIPSSVTTFGKHAFQKCTALSSVSIPNGVEYLVDYGFAGCTSLTSVSIPNSVSGIGAHVFEGCSALTSVTIPNNIKSISDWAFYGCSALTSITFPKSTTYIGSAAFYGCSGLTTITIPNSVTGIEENAFSNCNLSEIIVEEGGIFDSRNNCNAIIIKSTDKLIVGCKNTTIPNSVTTIGHHAFEGCSGLTSITIPNSVTSIEKFAFFGSGLTSITIPSSVTTMGYAAFSGCHALTSVKIPSSVTTIEGSTFYGCTGLTSIIIPDGVTRIEDEAFEACYSLTSVTIPNNMLSIGVSAFSRCDALTDIYCYAEEIPSLGTNSFDNPNDILHVPAVSLDAYKSSWSYLFKEIVAITQDDHITITAKSYTIKYGDELPTFEFTSEGATLEGTPAITCEATKTSAVGTYPIVITEGSVTNYNTTYVNGTLTIEKAPLTITAKNYTIKQGEALPTFEVEYSGFKNNETSQVLTKQPTITTTATSASDPGDYEITISSAEAQNYDITHVKGTLTITQADPVTITAKSYEIIYGEDLPTFEYTSEGAELDGTPSITCEATKNSPVGTYPIVITKGSVKNYNDTYVNGTLTIKKALLIVIPKDYNIKQGDELPTFEVTYEGFRNNETSAVLTKQPTTTTTATSTNEPGVYEINASGAEAQNYDISYSKGKLTIEAVEITPIQITADADLENVVIDNIYYNVKSANGDGYNATEQALVLNSTTTSEQMTAIQNAEVGDAAVRENYSGVIFEIPAGQGTITVDVKTIGTHVLNVQIGNNTPTKVTKSERGTVDVSYDVSEPTYVYLYASTSGGNTARLNRAGTAGANSVLLYGYKVTIGGTGINAIRMEAENGKVFDLNGRQVKTPGKGVYIINGRKVVVK